MKKNTKKSFLFLPLAIGASVLLAGCANGADESLRCMINGKMINFDGHVYMYYDNGYNEVGVHGISNEEEDFYLQVYTTKAGNFSLEDSPDMSLTYKSTAGIEYDSKNGIEGTQVFTLLDNIPEVDETLTGALSGTIYAEADNSVDLDCDFSVVRDD